MACKLWRAGDGGWCGRSRRSGPSGASGLFHRSPPPRARKTWRHGCGQTGRVLAAFWGEYRCWTFTGIEDWRFRCHHAAARRSCFPFPRERLRPLFGPNPLDAPQCDGCSLSIAVIGSSLHSVDFRRRPIAPEVPFMIGPSFMSVYKLTQLLSRGGAACRHRYR